MKKLIMFTAVAVAALASQAASVSWQYSSSSNEKNSHIYVIAGDSMPTQIADLTAFLAAATVVSDASVKWNSLSKKSTASASATSDTITKDKNYYFLMVDADGKNFKTAGTYAGTSMVFDTTQQESAPANTDFASSALQAASYTQIGGSTPTPAAPEPTSGILMLVGFGALALRRRKQA